jgi:hypothetical protein
MATAAFGQRVTRSFHDVSMSEALKWLNEQGGEYSISFLYNDLEDFRVTTTVKNKSVPDAIRQLIGFYPIKMTVQGKDIAVECPLREATRYKGTVLDETGQPLPYANVALLSLRDSTLITGGVTNESGLFVIPCHQLFLAWLHPHGLRTLLLSSVNLLLAFGLPVSSDTLPHV